MATVQTGAEARRRRHTARETRKSSTYMTAPMSMSSTTGTRGCTRAALVTSNSRGGQTRAGLARWRARATRSSGRRGVLGAKYMRPISARVLGPRLGPSNRHAIAADVNPCRSWTVARRIGCTSCRVCLMEVRSLRSRQIRPDGDLMAVTAARAGAALAIALSRGPTVCDAMRRHTCPSG